MTSSESAHSYTAMSAALVSEMLDLPVALTDEERTKIRGLHDRITRLAQVTGPAAGNLPALMMVVRETGECLDEAHHILATAMAR